MTWLREHKDELVLIACVATLATMLMHGLGGIALNAAVPMSIAGAVLLVYGFFKALERRRRPLRTERHRDLGEVKIFRDRWEASIPLMGRPVQIMGANAASPSDRELGLLQAITTRLPTIMAAGMDALREDLKVVKPPITSDQLALSSISLEPDNKGAHFSLYFDTPLRSKEYEWGLYVDFSDFDVVEAEWVH